MEALDGGIGKIDEATFVAFVTDTVASGWVDDRDGGDAEALLPTVVETDALALYCPLSAHGLRARRDQPEREPRPAHVTMPQVHRVASLLKRWLLGSHQGGVQQRHLDAYLDEFVFRFNRRTSRDRGKLFYRLIELATQHEQTTYRQLVDGPNPQRNGKPTGEMVYPDGEACATVVSGCILLKARGAAGEQGRAGERGDARKPRRNTYSHNVCTGRPALLFASEMVGKHHQLRLAWTA